MIQALSMEAGAYLIWSKRLQCSPNMSKHTLKKLIGGLEHFMFSMSLGMSSSQLTVIFFGGVGIPPARKDQRISMDKVAGTWYAG